MATDPKQINTTHTPGNDVELHEWLESIESLLRNEGPDRAREIFRALRDHLNNANVAMDDATLNTPYRNTISLDEQPQYLSLIHISEPTRRS